jgi:FkbM family methyltransferase
LGGTVDEEAILKSVDAPMNQLTAPLRRIGMRVFSRINIGDITITHHYTGDQMRIDSFRHRGYWYKGRRREQKTMEMFHALIKPGDIVFDVGAHVGYMTLYFLKLVGAGGTVYAFEPAPPNLIYLSRNLCGRPNAFLVEKGVGRTSGRLELYVDDLSGQNSSFIPNFDVLAQNAQAAGLPPTVERVTADVVSLDDFAESEGAVPSFLKIDVEGLEYDVLCGASRLIEQKRPMMMVEVWPRLPNQERLYRLLQGHGYAMFAESGEKLESADQLVMNIFCLHPARHGSFFGSRFCGATPD